MSTEVSEPTQPPSLSDVHVSPPARKGNPWAPTPRGVALVTRIELRRRRPSAKGYVFYGIIFAIAVGICILAAIMAPSELSSINLELALILILGIGTLIAPSLSATAINGDSGEGVLAPLQMTHLTAGDIAMGKLLSSWLVSVAALLALSPFLIFAYLKSGWRIDELVITVLAILLVVLAFTAVGLAWSAIAARAVASVSLAHLTTGFFVIGTLVVFALSSVLVTDTATQTDRYIDWESLTAEQAEALDAAQMSGDFSTLDEADYQCIEQEWTYGVTQTQHIAWMLLLNPVVMIGETAPIVDPETWQRDGRAEPGLFAMMHSSVAGTRMGPADDINDYQEYDECAEMFGRGGEQLSDEEMEQEWAEQDARWREYEQERANLARAPWIGLSAMGVLLFGSMIIVVRRLRVPYKKLRTGTRVA
ncbi:MAG: ABC transporter permease [Demequina sp.]